MKEHLLSLGFTEQTKNTYEYGEYVVVLRGNKCDIYDTDEWIGTANNTDEVGIILGL